MSKTVILVTGGAGGIGLACAHALKDYNLVLTDYKSETVTQAVDQLKAKGINAVGLACDITDQKALEDLAEFTKKQGNLGGLVHAAGVSGTVNNPKLVFDINLLATYNLIQVFKPLLGKGSAVVLLSSMMGHTVPAGESYDEALRNPKRADAYSVIEAFIDNNADTMYNFTKRGILLLAKDFARELGQKGARIATVSPGVILTPMGKKALEEHPEVMEETLKMTPMDRFGLPEDIAKAVRFLVSEDASFITGTDLVVDGGVLTQMLK